MTLADGIARACASLSDVTMEISHGRPSYFVGTGSKRRNFLVLHPDGHHDKTFPHVWLAAAPGVQEELIAAFPERFFRPPYVGHRGWVALRLDEPVDWDDVAKLCADAHAAVRR